jgi:glyoxylase-like metal-dependent hydrolase (beta-lactamase superfamily II)
MSSFCSLSKQSILFLFSREMIPFKYPTTSPTQFIQLGHFRLLVIPDRPFLVDGGSMFGATPKKLWNKKIGADWKNRILLGNNSLLVESNEERILIDLGLGDKYDEKNKEIYGIKQGPTIMDVLEEVGEINRIILTHLHFDHVGWITQRDVDGQIYLTFPRSEIIVQKQEWEAANNPNELNRSSYVPENIRPLVGCDNLGLIDGDMEISPGIKVILTGGHSAGHQVVKIESEGKTAMFWGDLVPTTCHLPLPYITAFDIAPHTTLY